MQGGPLQIVLGEASGVGTLVVVGILLLEIDPEQLGETHEVFPVSLLLTVTRAHFGHLGQGQVSKSNNTTLAFHVLASQSQCTACMNTI